MWTFKTIGEGEQPTGFEATFDGPVEDAGSALAVIASKAAELQPDARALAQEALNLTAGYVRGVTEEDGKRRFSVNLGGGVNPQHGWSLTLMLNLADRP